MYNHQSYIKCLANQLISLHIEDDYNRVEQWQFIEKIINPNPNTVEIESFLKQPWYPCNIQHLCLFSHYGSEFPELASLKIGGQSIYGILFKTFHT